MKPGKFRRSSVVRGSAALVAVLGLTACGAGSGENAPRSVPASTPDPSAAPAVGKKAAAATAAPEPTEPEPPGMVPLAPHRPPAEFKGDDAEFVRQVRGNLTEDKVDTKMSDSRLLTLGREFCSVLSGGGLLTDKVDHWAGFRELKQGVDAAIVLAAQSALCGDLIEGYTRLQLSELSEPTAAEQADLARFVAALDQPDLDPLVAQISDADVAGDAKDACELDFDSEWWNSAGARKLERGLPEQGRMAYVVGLVTAYCPAEADPMIESLEDWTG